MKTSKLFGCFAALAVAGFAWANEPAEPSTVETTENEVELTEETESPLSIELSMDIMSDYVFRGYISNDNPVWQPSVTVGYDTDAFGGIYANVWSSFDLTRKRGYDNAGRRACGLQEIDYTVGYAYTYNDFENDFISGINFELAHIWYTYPNGNGSSERDIFASVSLDTPFVTPSFSMYWLYGGIGETDHSTIYYTFSLSRDFEIGERLTLTPSASLGFGGNAWCQYMCDPESSYDVEMTDQTTGLSATYQLCDNLSLGAQINYTWIPSKTLRRDGYMCGSGDGKDHLVWGGVNMTLSF